MIGHFSACLGVLLGGSEGFSCTSMLLLHFLKQKERDDISIEAVHDRVC